MHANWVSVCVPVVCTLVGIVFDLAVTVLVVVSFRKFSYCSSVIVSFFLSSGVIQVLVILLFCL